MIRRVLLAALALVLVGCSSAPDGGLEGDSIGFQVGDGSVTLIEPDRREPAPDLAGPALGGGEISTADYAGQVLLLNVWGSWCAPCRAEAPALVQADAELPDVQFIGINTRDLDPAPAEAFVRSFEIEFPHIYDPDGSLLLGFGQLPPAAIPSTLIIDKQGRVAARILGETSALTLIELARQIEGEQ